MRGTLKSLVVGLCVFFLGSGLAIWLTVHNVHGFLALLDNALAGLAAGVVVLLYERRRQHAIDNLRESEKRFRLIANAAPVLIWMADTDKLCTYFNKPWLDFTGRSMDSELGNGWVKGVHPEDLQRCLDIFTQSFDRREKFGMEYRLHRYDGEYRWVLDLGVPRFDQDGSFVGYIGIAVDVTDSKRTEGALHDRERELTEAQRLARVGSWQWEPRTDTVIWTKELYHLMGIDPALPAPSYKEQAHLFAAESWERLQRAVQGALQTGTSYELDLEVMRPESIAKWEIARGEPVRDKSGQIIGLRGTVQDITGRKLTEEALSDMSRKLMDAHEQERTRIGRELHDDIVQQLAMLAVQLDGVQQDIPDSVSELSRVIGNLRTQTADIIDDVQSLSHFELHSSKLEYLGIDVAAKNFCKEFGEHQRVEIDFQSHDMPADLPTDVSLPLFRVLQEALSNATKHSGIKSFEVELWGSAEDVQLTVSDLGVGFDSEAATKGTGLGLTSMQERLRLVGGELSINSQPKRGTTVHARVRFISETIQCVQPGKVSDTGVES